MHLRNQCRTRSSGKRVFAFLLLTAVMVVPGCKQPEDRVAPAFQPDAEETKALLVSLKAEHVYGTDGMHFRSTIGTLKNCRKCHTEKGLINPKGIRDTDRKAHWDITLDHYDNMTCANCHDRTLPDMLATGNEPLSIEHSYELCGSCHSKQFEDWKGGAHGKRLTGWGYPRVVKLCVECHNPHKPHFHADPTVAPPQIIPDRLKGGKNDGH